MTRTRFRDLGLSLGVYPTGPHNALTDVPGVLVGHVTLLYDEPRIARTGVTVIAPREGNIWKDNAFAAYHSFNGTGEMTGMHWLTESGLLCYPIAITNTHQVGTVHEAIVAYGQENGLTEISGLPIVAETWDGWLNDLDAFHLKKEHVYAALASAKGGPVAEGNVGGGTGMICHDFKGGIGTASRVVSVPSGTFTIGALVQANHGDRALLRVDGAPVGKEIGPDRVPTPWPAGADDAPTASSIIIVVATDAPLIPAQCKRLAQRAGLGMVRAGGVGYNGSGDLFLAFATGNRLPHDVNTPHDLKMLPHHHLNEFFEAEAEAVEEAIVNAMCAAETMTGYKGHTVHALPLDELQRVMKKYQP
jgi:D-aminopeptidase